MDEKTSLSTVIYEIESCKEKEREAKRQKAIVPFSFMVFLLVFMLLMRLMFPHISEKVDAQRCDPSLSRAHEILKAHPVIDGHNDLAIKIRLSYGNHIYYPNFTKPFEKGTLEGQVDLGRMKEGRYSGAFWSAFYPCPRDIFDFSTEHYDPIVRSTLAQLDLLHRLHASYNTTFSPNPTPNTTAALHSFRTNRLISPLAIEGLHQIGNSFDNLRLYHALGVRYATLTWNCHNLFADAAVLTYPEDRFKSVKAAPYWGGVSKKGRQAIREMNRLGMIVDLAHVSDDTMRDVLTGQHDASLANTTLGRAADADNVASGAWPGSLAPPIVSHSSARALCPHPRNVPDEILRLVQQRNSLVMVNASPDFISCLPPCSNASDPGAPPAPDCPESTLPTPYPPHATLRQYVRHILHIGHLIGFSHVGIGTDFDGIETVPQGFEDVSKMPELVAELLRAGVASEDVVGVLGGNLLRVWGEVERVAARLRDEGVEPVEDVLRGFPGLDG